MPNDSFSARRPGGKGVGGFFNVLNINIDLILKRVSNKAHVCVPRCVRHMQHTENTGLGTVCLSCVTFFLVQLRSTWGKEAVCAVSCWESKQRSLGRNVCGLSELLGLVHTGYALRVQVKGLRVCTALERVESQAVSSAMK